MKVSRDLAIITLKYLYQHTDFYFPFLIVCKEYSPEDDDFVEIEPNEWTNIQEDESYQTFEIRENLKDIEQEAIPLLAKLFIDQIINNTLENEIILLHKKYGKLYKPDLTKSENILEYGENEFFGGKKEAFEDILTLLNKYKI